MTTQNKSEHSLNSFIEEVCGDSHLRVESDLGGGFVRLRISEAEKRQAAQDIRSSEDIVIEVLRNARDAGATNIFIALHREGDVRTIVILDDGVGIPPHMHEMVFEPRVTSKLDSAHMDKWGMHGRGMALYSISQNSLESKVVYSAPSKGASISVITNITKLPEKKDQSTFPVFELQDSGTFAMRGPKNIIRTVAEFSLEHRNECNVYCGSVSDVCATLYAHGMILTNPKERAFCANAHEAATALRLAYAIDPANLAELAKSLGLDISERTARRIISGDIKPIPSMMQRLEEESFSSLRKPAEKTKCRSSKEVNFSKEDLNRLVEGVASAFTELAEAYYLEDVEDITVRHQGDCLKLTIPLRVKG